MRIEALRILGGLDDARAGQAAGRILAQEPLTAALGVAAVEALSMQMMFAEVDHDVRHEIMMALQRALTNDRAEVRRAAVRTLASHRDQVLIETLASALKNPTDKSVAPGDAIRGLIVAGGARQYVPEIRAFLSGPDLAARAAAVTVLASDPASRSAIVGILSNPGQPNEVRSAALRALAAVGAETAPAFVDFLKRRDEPPYLREQAAAALATTVETFGDQLDKSQLDGIARDLRAVPSDGAIAPALGRALKATDDNLAKSR